MLICLACTSCSPCILSQHIGVTCSRPTCTVSATSRPHSLQDPAPPLHQQLQRSAAHCRIARAKHSAALQSRVSRLCCACAVRGYAFSGGGRNIIRVDVSPDGGRTWHVATLDNPGQLPYRCLPATMRITKPTTAMTSAQTCVTCPVRHKHGSWLYVTWQRSTLNACVEKKVVPCWDGYQVHMCASASLCCHSVADAAQHTKSPSGELHCCSTMHRVMPVQQLLMDCRAWDWTLWHIELPLPQEGQIEICCRAVDSSYNTQPDTTAPIWNMRGIINNAWHRVNVSVAAAA